MVFLHCWQVVRAQKPCQKRIIHPAIHIDEPKSWQMFPSTLLRAGMPCKATVKHGGRDDVVVPVISISSSAPVGSSSCGEGMDFVIYMNFIMKKRNPPTQVEQAMQCVEGFDKRFHSINLSQDPVHRPPHSLLRIWFHAKFSSLSRLSQNSLNAHCQSENKPQPGNDNNDMLAFSQAAITAIVNRILSFRQRKLFKISFLLFD